jgi:WD40 repeat protein
MEVADERGLASCVGGMPATYHDKQCWEWSPDRRTLALAYTAERKVGADNEFILIDTTTLQYERLDPPRQAKRQTFSSFAFSPDNRWLALGTAQGFLLYDRRAREWGRLVGGDHPRNKYLGPMRFTSDSSQLIALGDQLRISVHQVPSGVRIGMHQPKPDNWEGELKVSADGSRMLVYKFSSDTFEVLDGNAARIGWVCPYYCNMRHNPVQPPYAVSPDGSSVAISHRRGAAVWDTATDTIRFPLHDPKRKPLGSDE